MALTTWFLYVAHMLISLEKSFIFQKSRRLYVLVVKHIFRIHSHSVTEIFHPLNHSHFPCRNKEAHGKFKRCCMSISLLVVMVSQVMAYVQTCQNLYIIHAQFFVYQVYFNETLKKKSRGWQI